MSNQYPYIQTLQNIDESIGCYAMQSTGGDDEAIREDDPIEVFGPIGKINIFVGATNAGKSRFLRTLGKCNEYRFLTKEFHDHVKSLRRALDYLSNSQGNLEFRIAQPVMYDQRHAQVTMNMPQWVVDALKGVVGSTQSYVNFKAQYFQELVPALEKFIKYRFEAATIDTSLDSSKILKEAKVDEAIWARNLVIGEPKARIRDEKPNLTSNYRRRESLSGLSHPCLTFEIDTVSKDWQQYFILLWDSFEGVRDATSFTTETPPERIYIPTLRSAVSLSDNDGKRLNYDIFKETVIKNYALEDTGLDIFTGNTLYDTLSDDSRGSWEVIDRLSRFREFLGKAFYDGRNIEIVARASKYDPKEGQHIVIRVAGETPRDLHDLGDGISTLIILIYKMFMAAPGSWIFIEEPELNLHPGLQRVFLQTLLENEVLQKRNLRVFFTTHSNHLLRMTMRDGSIASNDISVFAFQQRESNKDRFLIRPLISEHHEALALLGVQNASVLLAQCGIWVEGHTDRKYLRAYLNAYQESADFQKLRLPKMREDTHFAFWEYAGSNLDHYLMSAIPRKGTEAAEEYERGKKEVLAEIQSSALCNRIFLLADQDRRKGEKHKLLSDLATNRSNFCYVYTRCIEIENVLSGQELKTILPKFLKGTPPHIPDFKEADYKDIRMGEFLQAKFPNNFPESWMEASGTLSTPRKKRLCELAVENITWDSMSPEAKRITKALYDFIAKHNNI